MNIMNFQIYSPDALYALLFDDRQPQDRNEAALSNLSPHQLLSCAAILQTSERSDAFERLVKLVNILASPSQLEALGRGLSLQQFLMLLVHYFHHPSEQHKLSPLLVGLPPTIFLETLDELSDEYLPVLKQESISEPLQHQLIVFEHDSERVMEELAKALNSLQKEIERVQVETLTYQELNQIKKQIEEIKQSCETRLRALNKALAITWNTNRIDLIDRLSRLKEKFNYLIQQQIGHPAYPYSTGLYSILENTLGTVFSAAWGQPKEDSLDDEDSALEGLAKFSIWYLEDYWNLGLLSETYTPAQLELEPDKHSDQDRLKHRQALFDFVQQQLNKLEIGTVGALKKAQIFSKPMLEDYIAKHRHLLKDADKPGH
ncbi:hypothetical protein [Candidatus Protochlamydia phocaeensis]|uniref:hypothetical protein n=1 Tax=Candidatus Protochlamydia phocaeensis TaxID=1414722 RepID=UPI0012AC0C6D|nr:hypothetical protein [Candidatus Protochlamydia phocaeensis]